MRKNDCKDFFQAVGLEGSVSEMLKQIGVGMVIGLALLAVIGVGDWIGKLIEG